MVVDLVPILPILVDLVGVRGVIGPSCVLRSPLHVHAKVNVTVNETSLVMMHTGTDPVQTERKLRNLVELRDVVTIPIKLVNVEVTFELTNV